MSPQESSPSAAEIELAEEDILSAMRQVPDYIDITTDDLRVLYHLAYRHARARMATPGSERPLATRVQEPPRLNGVEILLSWIGGFLGISALAVANALIFRDDRNLLLLGSFGATAVLIYGVMRSPFSQPRNVLGGNVVGAFVGVLCWYLFGDHLWLAEATAVATTIALMHATRTVHPPGGGTALIAVVGSAEVHRLGFWYVLIPAAIGPLVMLTVALIVNNLPKSRRYPELWF